MNAEPKNLQNYHLTMDEFRRQGRMLVDWIADYYERIESFTVLAETAS